MENENNAIELVPNEVQEQVQDYTTQLDTIVKFNMLITIAIFILVLKGR